MSIANMGTVDRVIRLLIGLGLFAYVFVIGPVDPGSRLGIGMLVVGGIMILTSVISFCPLYPLLGIRTRSK